jgi:hypothetical protein
LIEFGNGELDPFLEYSLPSLVTETCAWELEFDLEDALGGSGGCARWIDEGSLDVSARMPEALGSAGVELGNGLTELEP